MEESAFCPVPAVDWRNLGELEADALTRRGIIARDITEDEHRRVERAIKRRRRRQLRNVACEAAAHLSRVVCEWRAADAAASAICGSVAPGEVFRDGEAKGSEEVPSAARSPRPVLPELCPIPAVDWRTQLSAEPLLIGEDTNSGGSRCAVLTTGAYTDDKPAAQPLGGCGRQDRPASVLSRCSSVLSAEESARSPSSSVRSALRRCLSSTPSSTLSSECSPPQRFHHRHAAHLRRSPSAGASLILSLNELNLSAGLSVTTSHFEVPRNASSTSPGRPVYTAPGDVFYEGPEDLRCSPPGAVDAGQPEKQGPAALSRCSGAQSAPNVRILPNASDAAAAAAATDDMAVHYHCPVIPAAAAPTCAILGSNDSSEGPTVCAPDECKARRLGGRGSCSSNDGISSSISNAPVGGVDSSTDLRLCQNPHQPTCVAGRSNWQSSIGKMLVSLSLSPLNLIHSKNVSISSSSSLGSSTWKSR